MSVAEILRKPETLRKLLDERDVEHYDRFDVTEWVGSDGEICHTSVNYSNGATVLVLRKCTTPAQAIEATLERGTCKEVYLLMATDIGDGREEVLGVYATEEAAIAAINENQFGYALHHVRKWEVDE